jgi:mono/diheme cytochrome c family protein
MNLTTRHLAGATLAWAALSLPALAATPAQLLAAYSAQAGTTASPERGQRFFTTVQPGEFGWSCATCHGATPTGKGKNALSDKPIAPLAPAFNPARFTDKSKTDGWFRNNCKDVVGRDCSASERADVLSWLLTLKP